MRAIFLNPRNKKLHEVKIIKKYKDQNVIREKPLITPRSEILFNHTAFKFGLSQTLFISRSFTLSVIFIYFLNV